MKILLNANLYKAGYNIIVYKIRIEEIIKNIKKKRAKIFIKINKSIYSKIIIEKIE